MSHPAWNPSLESGPYSQHCTWIKKGTFTYGEKRGAGLALSTSTEDSVHPAARRASTLPGLLPLASASSYLLALNLEVISKVDLFSASWISAKETYLCGGGDWTVGTESWVGPGRALGQEGGG